jgi:hypothetical protein
MKRTSLDTRDKHDAAREAVVAEIIEHSSANISLRVWIQLSLSTWRKWKRRKCDKTLKIALRVP